MPILPGIDRSLRAGVLLLAVSGAQAGEGACQGADAPAAKAAIATAAAALAEASSRRALWTVAVDALEHAKRAAQNGHCKEAIRHARKAESYARLGIEQLRYPPYRIP